MSHASRFTVLDEVFDPLARCLTPEVARRIVALRASEDVQRRMNELADKSSAGTLSPQERAEYEAWVRAVNLLGVLQAKARKVVTPAPVQ